MQRRLLTGALALVTILALAPATQAGDRGSAKPRGGATTLALDPATAQALTDLGVTVAPLRPAAARSGGIAFPITGGRLNPETYAGEIRHAGGLQLSTAGTRVRVRDFAIRIDATPDLTARVVGGPRISLLDLDLSQAQISRSGRGLTVAGVKATLSDEGAAALNAAFGTSFQEGLAIGTATVRTSLKGHDRGSKDDDDRDDDD